MIFWNDFVFDEIIGPVLNLGGRTSVVDQEAKGIASIRETRQEGELARMAGISSLSTSERPLQDGGRG